MINVCFLFFAWTNEPSRVRLSTVDKSRLLFFASPPRRSIRDNSATREDLLRAMVIIGEEGEGNPRMEILIGA